LANSLNFHIIEDERLVSKVEGKTNFSMHLKQFDGLTRLTLTFITTDLRLWQEGHPTGKNIFALSVPRRFLGDAAYKLEKSQKILSS